MWNTWKPKTLWVFEDPHLITRQNSDCQDGQSNPGQRITSPCYGNALKFADLRCGLVMRWPPMSASPLAGSAERLALRLTPGGQSGSDPLSHGQALRTPSQK